MGFNPEKLFLSGGGYTAYSTRTHFKENIRTEMFLLSKQVWGVFYDNRYKRELIQECDTYGTALEEKINWSLNNEGDPNYFVDEVRENDRTPSNIEELINGQMEFDHLKSPLSKEYEVEKIQMWLCMLNDGKRPTEWRPSKEGTEVDFDYLKKGETHKEAVKELSFHIDAVNEQYGMNIQLKNQ